MTVLFWMWEPRRHKYIKNHQFLLEQGKKRITVQFSDRKDFEHEADAFADQWLVAHDRFFDSGRHDPSDFYEQANEERIDFMLALDDLAGVARASLVAALYHQWDKTLREWLTCRDSLGAWNPGGVHVPKALWARGPNELLGLLDKAGVLSEDCSIQKALIEFGLAVNVYKHGKGRSLDQLKPARPDFFDQWDSQKHDEYLAEYVDHTNLYIKDDHIEELSQAIVQFWRAMPEHIRASDYHEFPQWFLEACRCDGVIKN